MRTTRIFTKIFLSNGIIGLFSVITISIIFYFLIRNTLIERTLDQLASVNTLKAEQIDSYFRQHEKDLKFLFSHDFSREHFAEIKSVYDFRDITVLDKSFNGSAFSYIDSSEADYTKLLYFIQSQDKGYIVVEENFSKVERLLLENAGMGSTGECYLVGPDNRLRSASRFFPERPPLIIQVDEQTTGPDHIRTDYRGMKVISFSRELENPSLRWRIVSEIDFSEAMEPVVRFRNYLLIITVACAILILVVSVFLSNAISKPVLYLRQIIQQLARGILPSEPASVNNTDEIGQIARAVNQLVAGLRQTTDFAYQIGRGNFETKYTSLSDQDTLGLALIHMRDQLKQFNEREIRLVRDKTAALIEGQENERKRLTQELHDGVGQLLTAIRLLIETTSIDTTQRKEIVDLINETIAEVKRISYNVMPGSLVDFGLEAALKGLSDNTARYASFRIDFRYIRESNHTLTFDVTVAVFRIVQEGFNNILKHASAKNVELHILDKGDSIYVLLKDDGKGFDSSSRGNAGLGLRSMTERAKLLGGSVDIHSSIGEGTIVEAHIPLVADIES